MVTWLIVDGSAYKCGHESRLMRDVDNGPTDHCIVSGLDAHAPLFLVLTTFFKMLLNKGEPTNAGKPYLFCWTSLRLNTHCSACEKKNKHKNTKKKKESQTNTLLFVWFSVYVVQFRARPGHLRVLS